jgi:hypothetical protein
MVMRRNQLGISLGGLLVASFLLIVIAMLGIKLVPSYLEFMSIKKAVNAIAAEARGGSTVVEIRRAFDNRSMIDDIHSVKGSDLEISKDATGVTVAAGYRKEVPLVSNLGVYIDFRAVSKD